MKKDEEGYDFESQVKARPGIFINGAHHPRELTSITMVMYMMLKFLYEYVNDVRQIESDFIEKRAAFFFIPIVNLDGFLTLENIFKKTGKIYYLRKNKNTSHTKKKCSGKKQYEYGVDLNRNYGYGFGGPNAETDPCGKTYGGPYPFSEPETQSIKKFMEKWTNIKLVLNVHTWGNFICVPFLAGDKKNMEIEAPKYARARAFYDKLETCNFRPKGNKIGNVEQTLGYRAPGTATDWMLSELNVTAITPELGTVSSYSRNFFLASWYAIEEVLT